MRSDNDTDPSANGLGLGVFGLFVLAALIFLVVGQVFSTLTGLLAAPLLLLAARIPPGRARVGFRPAYGAAAASTAAFLAVTGAVVFPQPDDNALQSLLLAHIPSLAVRADVVAGSLSDACAGLANYLRALVANAASPAAAAAGTLAVGMFTLGA